MPGIVVAVKTFATGSPVATPSAVAGQSEIAAGARALQSPIAPLGVPVVAAELERVIALQHRQRVGDRRDVVPADDRRVVGDEQRDERQREAGGCPLTMPFSSKNSRLAADFVRVAAVLDAEPQLVVHVGVDRPVRARRQHPPAGVERVRC